MTKDRILEKQERARALFRSGANCSQSVLGAFQEECGLDMNTLMKLASGFGGGVARMREVCGALSGMVMAADLIKGNGNLEDREAKEAVYVFLQPLIAAFKEKTGSVVCKELLGMVPCPNGSVNKLPCIEMVALAVGILAEALPEA